MFLSLINHLYSAIGDVGAWNQSTSAIEQCRRRPSSVDPVTMAAIDTHLLDEHVRNATAMHRRMLLSTRRLRGAEAALDRCGHAVFVLGTGAEVVLLNRAAEQLLDWKDGVARSGTSIVAETPVATRELRAAVAAVGADPTAVLLPRKNGEPALTAVMAAGNAVAPAGDRQVIMFVVDPRSGRERSGELFSRMYGFTRTEAEVALLLMLGCSIQEVTERQHISLHTARTHLKRLLLKTDTNRQGELVMFLLTSPAALMRPTL
jgi:DNA-binding CsgD family transcriptional regulator